MMTLIVGCTDRDRKKSVRLWTGFSGASNDGRELFGSIRYAAGRQASKPEDQCVTRPWDHAIAAERKHDQSFIRCHGRDTPREMLVRITRSVREICQHVGA